MKSQVRRCFVISPIGPAESKVRDRADKILRFVVRPVCDELGFVAYRADEISHGSLITRRVMEEVLTADLVIADLTGSNPNVYYELAVRHFIGKPVVQLIEASEKLPFDLMDVNTIHLDHTDLASVHEAQLKLREVIRAGCDDSPIANPISVVLEALNIQVRRGRDTRTLAETFEAMATRIIDELRESRTERELLWSRLFEAQVPEPAQFTDDDDLSGAWRSNLGAVQLIQEGDKITGQYEYLSQGWVGTLMGRVVDEQVLFLWKWKDFVELSGVGYWERRGGQLEGRWFYREEASFTLAEMVDSPTIITQGSFRLRTREKREWHLQRA